MAEEIREGDWISWPESIGRDEGRVGSLDSEVYNVRQRIGDSWISVVVAKNERVRKVDPPPGEE